MGYRSDVAIAFYICPRATDIGYPALKLWFDENYPRATAVDEWEATIDYNDTGIIVVTYDNVNWYNGYDHVEAVNAARDRFVSTFRADHSDGLGSWEMVIIGEKLKDITHEGSDYHDYRLGVRREIYVG